MRARKIRTKLDASDGGKLGGWLNGHRTYLWFGVDGKCKGTLGGPKLLRLAKAIVRQMEGRRPK